MKARSLLFIVVLLLGSLSGCSSYNSYFTGERTVALPHDPNSLWNLKLGREYAAAGRFELAKEHYLMALASSDDTETRTIATHELHAVDMMIEAQR